MWSPLRLFAWVSVAVLPALLPTASVQGAEPEALVAVVPSIKSIESVNPGELQVEWAWIVKEKPENDWTVFFHLRKSGVESDQGFSAGDYKPNLPTSSWRRGKTVTEFRRASIPADLSGKFDVLVGLYQEEGGQRAFLDCTMDPNKRFLAGQLEITDGRVKFTPSR